MIGRLCLLGLVALAAGVVGPSAIAQGVPGARPETRDALERGDWLAHAGTNAALRWSPLAQINRENASRLRIAWRWRSPDHALREAGVAASQSFRHAATPLKIGDTLFTSTSLSQVAAIDAATGATKWLFDPRAYRFGPHPANNGWTHRGVGYWRDGDDERIILLTKYALMVALDARTGKPIPSFGGGGWVDLASGLRRRVERAYYDTESPPLIVGDIVVVGSSIWDWWGSSPMPPGDVRGFDVRTGRLVWTFHTVPREGEPGVETWENGSWRVAGNTNVWTQMSADEELGLVYLPISTPTNDYYGGHRHGDNLYGESLVCLEAATGRRVWHFQIVHHGLWDYDLPAAPNLLDIVVDGRPIKAVAQATKQGFIFVFDRVSGRPVWPIEERPVPQSRVRGERTSPTQPFPSKPAPIGIQGVREADLIDFTADLRHQALAIIERYDHGPLYTPPSARGTINVPGVTGTVNWEGAAVDPETGIMYVAPRNDASVVRLRTPSPGEGSYEFIGGFESLPSVRGLPLFKPPYASVLAIDMHAGEHLWRFALGRGPVDHPLLRGLGVTERLGSPGVRGWALATKTVLFVTKSGALSFPRNGPYGRRIYDQDQSDAHLWVHDKTTGAMLAEIPIGSNAGGSPMTYMAGGKQFVAFSVGGGNVLEELIALALP